MSNVFKEQTKEEFDAEMWEALAQIECGETYTLEDAWDEMEKEQRDEIIRELFPAEELEEALAQIERGETYPLDEVLDEIEKELDNEIQSRNIRISKGKSA